MAVVVGKIKKSDHYFELFIKIINTRYKSINKSMDWQGLRLVNLFSEIPGPSTGFVHFEKPLDMHIFYFPLHGQLISFFFNP